MLDMALARVLPSGASELLLVRSPAVDDDDAAGFARSKQQQNETTPVPSPVARHGTSAAITAPVILAGSRPQAAGSRPQRPLARSLGDQGYTVGLSG